MTFQGTVDLGGTARIFDNQVTATQTFANAISNGNVRIYNQGSGTVVFSGANSYGTTTVEDYNSIGVTTLQITDDSNLGTGTVYLKSGKLVVTGATDIDNDVTIQSGSGTVQADALLTLSGVLSGSGNLTKAGAGTLTLSGSNSYTGSTTISAGTLAAASNTALGDIAGATTVESGATLAFSGGVTVAEAVTVGGTGDGGNGALRNDSGDNTLTAILSATANYVVGGASGTLTLAGQIDTASWSLSKNGAGTVVLSGTGSTTDGIVVNDGTLLVTGSVSGGATVGGTLGGTGTVEGAVSVSSIGTLAPGVAGTNSGAGTLTLSNGLTIAAGGTLSLDIAGTTAGTGYDQVVVVGAVDVTGATIAVATYTVTGSSNNTFIVISNNDTDAVTGAFANVAEGGSFTSNGQSFRASYVGGTNTNDVTLQDNSPPTLDLNGGDFGTGNTVTLADAANGLAVVNAATAADADGNWTGGTLTVQRVTAGGAADGSVHDVFAFLSGVTFTGSIAQGSDSTGTVSVGGTQIGTWAYTANGTGAADRGRLVVAFDAGATSTRIETLVRNIGYANATPYGDTTIRLTLADGAATSVSADVTVTSSVIYADTTGDTDSDGDAADGFSLREALARGVAQAGADSVKVKLADNATISFGSGVTAGAGDTLDLSLANGLTIDSSTFTLAGDLTLTTGAGKTASIQSQVAGTGSALTKTGTGTITLTAGTRTGTTTVSAGTLEVDGDALPDAGAVTVADGATLRLTGNETIGSLTGAGAVELGTSTLTTGGDNTATGFSGGISGTGGLTKQGSGAFTLSGTNTYTGMTTVAAGTLEAAGGAAIADTGAVLVTGGTFQVSAAETIGSLAGTGGTVALGGHTLTVNQSAAGTLVSALTGTAAAGLIKAGSGTLTLSSAANETGFLGTTAVTGGSLSVADDNRLGAGTVTLDGGILAVTGTGAQTIDNALALGSSGGTIHYTLTGGSDAVTLTGLISGSSTLTKTGAGTLTLDNTGNSAATAGLTVTGGAVAASTDSRLLGGTVTLDGGALAVTGGNTYDNAIALGAGGGTINGAFFTQSTAIVSGIVSGSGTLTKRGQHHRAADRRQHLHGPHHGHRRRPRSRSRHALGATAGGTVVSSGTTLVIDGVTIAEAVTITGTGVSGLGAILATSGTGGLTGDLTLAGNASIAVMDGGTLTVSGIIDDGSFTYNLTKASFSGVTNGTLVLTGANIYGGTTTVSAGTLVAGSNTALGITGGTTTVASGATLAISDGVTFAEAISLAGTGFGGAGALTLASGSSTLSSQITLMIRVE